VGADDFPFPLQVKLDQVPGQHKTENQEKEEDDNLEAGQQNVGEHRRREILRFAIEKFDNEEKNDEQDDDGSDDARASFS
jgi:hypothetical protein